ncbi:MAG: hypothetical protein K0R92_2350 [Lachnospiraceae bacterium]|jgi:hypothetical protein|nr:hypothetical protein [Lachnospiraceae bacterium]
MIYNVYLVAFSASIACILVLGYGIGYIKKHLKWMEEEKDKATTEGRKKQLVNLKNQSTENTYKFSIIVFTFLCVEATCLIDIIVKSLILKRLMPNCLLTNKELYAIIEDVINGGFIILVGMIVSSFLMKKVIRRINIIPDTDPVSISNNSMKNNLYNKREKLVNQLTFSYSLANCVIIIGLIIIQLYDYAVTWGFVLAGKFIWFGIYDVSNADDRKEKNKYSPLLYEKIIYIAISAYFLVYMISLQYQLEIVSDIIMGSEIAFILSGLIIYTADKIIRKIHK